VRADMIESANASAEAFLERLEVTANAMLCAQGRMTMDPSTAREWVRLTRTYIECVDTLLKENKTLQAQLADSTAAVVRATEMLKRLHETPKPTKRQWGLFTTRRIAP
jgi:hypothetical protein